MTHELVVAFSMLVVPPVAATSPDQAATMTAPAGTADTRYCLRVERATGSLVETVRCWTRQQWAEQGVNVDKEWDKEGVRVLR